MSGRGYIHAANPFAEELDRLRLLESRCDPDTRRRLAVAGPLIGLRCLEVGAGAGSVTRMLAELVGGAGEVVAIDIDTRFLTAPMPANVRVLRHDINRDPVPLAAFDLVHCRALLMHLSDPMLALTRMAAAVRPGGWLVIEDADYTSVAAADRTHPVAAAFDRIAASMRATKDVDSTIGGRLPALLDALGLESRGDEMLEARRCGGDQSAGRFAYSMEAFRAMFVGSGVVTHDDLELVLSALADPKFQFVDSRNVASWGRRSR